MTQLNAYELGNKTDIDDLTTNVDTSILAAMTTTLHSATSAVAVETSTPVTYGFNIADAATDNYDLVMPAGHNFKVTDVTVVKTGGAGGANDTVGVLNNTDAITDAIDINAVDTTIVRATTIDDAFATIAAGGTLRVAVVNLGGANVACEVYVHGLITA
ncbi:hypothetical protein [uncultured Mediterranean phage]|nr:hypothetical protein [uncultured Mediterranean phage]